MNMNGEDVEGSYHGWRACRYYIGIGLEK